MIEPGPVSETPDDRADPGADEISETQAYPADVAGTVTELYGDSGEAEQNETYHDAVSENPLLRYTIVYFDFNSYDIKPESRELLIQHAGYLSGNPDVEVSLEGHADRRGSGGYNLALGERRARAVKSFLHANAVRDSQTSAISYGEERPALEGDSEEAHARNRRVEIIYR